MRLRESACSSGSAVSESALRTALDVIVSESLRPISVGLSTLYTIFAVSHRLVLPEAVATRMMLIASGTAALLLGLHLVLDRWAIPSRWAHPIAAGIAGLVLLNSLLHLVLLSEPQQTTNLMLLAVGVGCVFLSTVWLVLVLAATVAGWSCRGQSGISTFMVASLLSSRVWSNICRQCVARKVSFGAERSKRSWITQANLRSVLLVNSYSSGNYIPTEWQWIGRGIENNGTRRING